MEPEKITFPCDYPVKVVTHAREGLREALDGIFQGHFGDFEAERVSIRESAQSNFVSYTYLMVVQHVDQLSALHVELRETEGVVMVL
jgi:putative lipoic acid-binding regulatory protein